MADDMMGKAAWLEGLERLGEFVAGRPEIRVSKTGLAIPKTCRDEFYARVDGIRRDLTEQLVASLPDASENVTVLGNVLEEFSQATGATLVLPSALEAFRVDPLLGSSEPIVGDILSYVQGSLTAEGLLETARRDVVANYRQMSLAAYETWAACAFVLALGARKAYLADSHDDKTVVCTATDTLALGRQKYSPTLRLPGAVFECASGYWAVKFELAQELDFYASKPLRRRDFSAGGDTRGTIGRRYLMLYRVGSLDAVPIVANRDKKLVFPPTAMVGTFVEGDFSESLYGRAAIQRVASMKPVKGALFASDASCSADAMAAVEEYGARIGVVDRKLDRNLFNEFIETLA